MEKTYNRQYEDLARSVAIPTPEREAELSSIIMGKEGDARDMAVVEMVGGHMRMVLDLTNKYKRMPDYIDTLFDGHFGLIRAVLTYDHRLGKFSTWATPKIKTEIRDGLLSRLNSPLSVTRYATELAFKIKNLLPDKNGDIETPDLPVAKLAMLGIMDAISMYNDDGTQIDIEDDNMCSALDEVQKNDLLELVHKVTSELGMSEDDITLVSEACGKSGKNSIVPILAKRLGVSQSNVRMLRSKLLWKIRKRILSYVGKEEYLMLSAIGHIPSRSWRQ